jgi:hypothetical protein
LEITAGNAGVVETLDDMVDVLSGPAANHKGKSHWNSQPGDRIRFMWGCIGGATEIYDWFAHKAW